MIDYRQLLNPGSGAIMMPVVVRPKDQGEAGSMRAMPGVKGTGRRIPERRVLREEIRDHLMKEILDGHLAPGDRIIETRIAQQFGVSQAPVREALRDLELFGFIDHSPFRGASVRQISAEEHLQLYPIRSVLEGLAARYAAASISESDLRRLQKLMATMRSAAARGDARDQIAADFRFHRTIMEASGNWLLLKSWERMQLATTTFLTIARSHRSLKEIAERHEPVLEALRARDPVGAEQAMRKHIEEPGEWMREALQQEEAEAGGTKAPNKGSDEGSVRKVRTKVR
jgi:DNA-binding GntR family transcriptional regulator